MAEPAEKPETYYDTLGVPKDADKTAIKRAYRKKALRDHPDRGGDKDQFQKIQRAYMVLIDPKLRDHYDKTGDTGAPIPTPTQKAFENLAQLFQVVLNENLANIERVDVLETVLANIKNAEREPTKNIKILAKRMQKLKAAESRLIRKSKKYAPEIFEQIIGTEIQLVERNIAAERDLLEMFRIMAELANEYEYTFDKVEPAPVGVEFRVLHV